MDVINLSTLSVVLVVLALLFGFFLFTVKTKNKLGNYLLGAYFLIMAIDFSAYFMTLHPGLELFRNDFSSFTSRPLIYLYVLSVLYSDFKLRKKHLLHLIWFGVVLAIMIPWYLADIDSQVNFRRNALEIVEGKFILYFSLIHTQVYIITIFAVLIKYKKVLTENFSSPNFTNYRWLFQMTLMLQGFFFFVLIKNMFRVYSYNQGNVENSRILLVVFMIIFLSWLLLKALHAPQIFRGIDSKINRLEKIPENAKLNPTVKKQVEELEHFMATNEPFLDSDLTIQRLASQVNLSVRELSILINFNFEQHFYNFINTYRIEKAKQILVDPDSKELTISEILYQVGFNSKSSFNTSFKKQVGFTPSEFRKRNISS